MKTLWQRTRDILGQQTSVISDEEILVLNYPDFSLSEISQVSGFLDLVNGIRISSYRETQLLQYVQSHYEYFNDAKLVSLSTSLNYLCMAIQFISWINNQDIYQVFIKNWSQYPNSRANIYSDFLIHLKNQNSVNQFSSYEQIRILDRVNIVVDYNVEKHRADVLDLFKVGNVNKAICHGMVKYVNAEDINEINRLGYVQYQNLAGFIVFEKKI